MYVALRVASRSSAASSSLLRKGALAFPRTSSLIVVACAARLPRRLVDSDIVCAFTQVLVYRLAPNMIHRKLGDFPPNMPPA